ncbi:response regulator [Cyclobacterium qasimii]|uniref:Response regulator n=2 Tax=Cyclobacterium qasimii TaxID=1350429 RepID=S7WI57_9BACT|nr:response regulator [Cyclobacterium qasimii]EPR66419.1 response regulator [Cyclobacterium qasimii M12-11B]GEO21127.1 response regulator [Cyclobacterium qasimii]
MKLKNILLVDDDSATNFFHKIVIKRTGFSGNVSVVENGLEAVEFLQDCADGKHLQPDLILLDINMPIMNAWEFLEKFKELALSKSGTMVIIMLSTSLNPDDELRAKNIDEIADFRQKPLSVQSFQKIIDTYFKEV